MSPFFVSRFLSVETAYFVCANILLGMLIMVSLHCLITAFQSRQKTYLYLGLFFIGALINAVGNLYIQFIVPTIEPYIGSWVMMFSFILFIEHYLKLPHSQKRRNARTALLFLCVLFLILSVANNIINGRGDNAIIFFMDVWTAVLLLSLLGFLLYHALHRNKQGQLLLIFELTIVIGGIFALGVVKVPLVRLGIMPIEIFQGNFIFLVGMTLNGILFSHVLGRDFVKLRVEKALSNAKAQELKEADRVKTEFMMNMSHEFRTPLTIISGVVKQLSLGVWGDSLSKNTRQLKIIERNSLRLLKQVNNLLKLSQFDVHSTSIDPVPIKLQQTIQALIGEFQSLAEQKKLELNAIPIPPDIMLTADPTLLHTALVNLISNAIKFTPSGGSVFLSVENNEEEIRINVADTGIGIPEVEQKVIFQRFHQVQMAGKPVRQGAGIGLSLVAEIVKQHNGRVELESRPQQGSRFSLIFPAINSTAMLPDTQSDVELPEEELISSYKAEIEDTLGTGNGTFIYPQKDTTLLPLILVVEDSSDLREYLHNILSPHFRCAAVGTGAEALQWLEQDTPELILCDIMMPEMDGYQLFSALQAEEKTAGIPVIFLTARDSEEEKIKSLQNGAADYMKKPFSPELLVAKIRNVIETNSNYQSHVLKMMKNSLVQHIKSFPLVDEEPHPQSFISFCNDAQLTQREMEIAELIRKGLSDKEIAAQLGLSVKTIGNYNTTIFRKCGVSGRLELITLQLNKQP